MRISNQEKLDNIYAQRIDMLKRVKSYIEGNSLSVWTDVEAINDIIAKDEKAIKEYTKIASAQSIIYNMVEEINNSSSLDEIVELRKKVNYYISKIKKEMKKREIVGEELENYLNSTSYLRNGINKYIRFLRRENNINNIEFLLNSESIDDKKKLTRLLNNERRFNNNFNLENKTNKNSNKITNNDSFLIEKKNDTSQMDNNYGDFEFSFEEPKNKSNNSYNFDNWILDDLSKDKSEVSNVHELATVCLLEDETYHQDYDYSEEMKYDYINRRVKLFSSCYHVNNLYGYSNSFAKNVVSFFRNIPRYLSNKKAIVNMEDDYDNFYRGSDLLSYIEYSKKRNSILRSFGQLFNRSYLSSRANRYLNDHNQCVNWVMDYLNRNEFDLCIPVKKR